MSERQIVICSKRGGVSPVGYRRIDVTSHAKDVFRQCSPFVLGPIPLYGGFTSKNMENAWQYAKLYRQFADVESFLDELKKLVGDRKEKQ